MSRYINPFTDIGFKRIFGQEVSKPLLIDFLNNMFQGEKVIADLTFLDKEQIPVFAEDRALIYDIYCTTETGEKIIVEMQSHHQPSFKKRSIYYTAEAISRQGEKGINWKYEIKSVYFVAFMNFKSMEIGEEFRTDVALMDMKRKEIFSSDMRLIYLQLPYFNKEEADCDNDFDKWIYLLKNMEVLQRLPWDAQNAIFSRLSEIAEVGHLSREERIKYDSAIRHYRDNLNIYEDTLQHGIEQGRTTQAQATARSMKSDGMPIEAIIKYSGLTKEEIEAL